MRSNTKRSQTIKELIMKNDSNMLCNYDVI